MKILVLNCGSSSIKFQLIETDSEMIESDTDRCIAKGGVERIGTDEATLKVRFRRIRPCPRRKRFSITRRR